MKKIIIDTSKKQYPMFINKDYDNPLWLEVEIGLNKDETVKGRVISITSNGKYVVEITKE